MLRIAVAEPEDELPQVVRGSPCRSVVKTMGPSMPQSTTPSNYEDLIRTIHERYDDMSKSYQRIAVYLTQNPNDVAVLSVGAIAERCGVHASNVVRFAQALGYGIRSAIRALERELGARKDRTERGFLHDFRDIASLQNLLVEISDPDLKKAVSLLEKAEVIYLIGQLRSSPVADLLRYILTMLGKRCVLLDPSGGLATRMARAIRKTDLLIAISFRFYATEVVNIVDKAAKRKVPVIAISDSTLSPVAKAATVLFAVPEHEYTFSRSLAAPMCLAQALTVALAARLQGNSADPRIPTVTEQ